MQIKAKIVDENGVEIPNAHVVVLNLVGQPATIGGFVVGDYTDFDGNFVINSAAITSITTMIKITAVGFKSIIIPVAQIVAAKGIITLNTDSTMLPETTVYGKRKIKFSWWWVIIPIGIGTGIAAYKQKKNTK